jgi:hypothetical protein
MNIFKTKRSKIIIVSLAIASLLVGGGVAFALSTSSTQGTPIATAKVAAPTTNANSTKCNGNVYGYYNSNSDYVTCPNYVTPVIATDSPTVASTTVAPAAPVYVPTAPVYVPPAVPVAPAPAASLPVSEEQNAINAAQQYLQTMPFSREGLIQQLSSSAGAGYPVAVATEAVDSLNINYNDQATRAAQQYLQTMPFSCQGLIQQLESCAGAGYTNAQAVYGVDQTGLCG